MLLVAVVLGFLAWSGVEYLIHGVLSHRFRTFVSPLHWGHHREPRAVFTSPVAVVPSAGAIFVGVGLVVGWGPAAAFTAGLVVGFARYEYVHWRIHFRAPRNAREHMLRDHHLAHHFRNPRAYHGVTTRFWDRLCGTLPSNWPADYARVSDRAPLEGASNLRATWSPRLLWAHAAAALRDRGERVG